MKPPNHGMRVRVTAPYEGLGPEVEFEGYLALNPTLHAGERGLILLPDWVPVYITDRIELIILPSEATVDIVKGKKP